MEKRIRRVLSNKTAAEHIVDKGASYWAVAVGGFSAMYFIYAALKQDMWALKNALTLMVATTPCALKVALPIAKYSTLSGLTANKIFLRDFKALANASKARTVVFDKTNTLTDMSRISINELHYSQPQSAAEQQQVLELLYAMELNSNHPIATEIVKHISQTLGGSQLPLAIQDFAVLGGSKAIRGSYTVDGQEQDILIGSMQYLRESGLLTAAEFASVSDEAVVMSVNGKLQLWFDYTERLRDDAVDTIIALQKMGKQVVIASGDTQLKVDIIANRINRELLEHRARPLDRVYAGLSPTDKINIIRSLQKDANDQKQYVVMIGDGDNDSEAIAAADFGISWNASGLARNGAHAIVTEGDRLSKIMDIFRMSKRYYSNVLGNAAITVLGNAAIIAGINTDFIGSQLLYPLGEIIGGAKWGVRLRSLDLLIALAAHESLSIFTALNAKKLDRQPGLKTRNKGNPESP
jgi:P-type E1-E2 ATPase